jgi:CRP/FNR family nitrogen fixation transcriptional regulator
MLAHTVPTPRPSPAPIDCGLIQDRGPVGAPLSDLLPGVGVRMTYSRDEELFGEGERADFVYRVVSGAVRTYRVLGDGRRQISDFLLPGDMLGLEAGAEHRMGAESIGSSVLMVVRRSSLAALAANDRTVAGQIWAKTVHDLQRAQDHMLLLGRQGACERVCAFLLDLSSRMPPGRDLELPMSRQDIADYLGLTIETVSRTFTQLQGAGWIELPALRRIVLTNRAAIARVCG